MLDVNHVTTANSGGGRGPFNAAQDYVACSTDPCGRGNRKGWGAPLQSSTFRLSIVPTKLLVLQCRLVTKSAFMQTYTAARAALLEQLTA